MFIHGKLIISHFPPFFSFLFRYRWHWKQQQQALDLLSSLSVCLSVLSLCHPHDASFLLLLLFCSLPSAVYSSMSLIKNRSGELWLTECVYCRLFPSSLRWCCCCCFWLLKSCCSVCSRVSSQSRLSSRPKWQTMQACVIWSSLSPHCSLDAWIHKRISSITKHCEQSAESKGAAAAASVDTRAQTKAITGAWILYGDAAAAAVRVFRSPLQQILNTSFFSIFERFFGEDTFFEDAGVKGWRRGCPAHGHFANLHSIYSLLC